MNQKKLLITQMVDVQKSKHEMLHKSLQLFFKVHFLADKRKNRIAKRQRMLDGMTGIYDSDDTMEPIVSSDGRLPVAI